MNNVQLFTTPIVDGMLIEKYYGIVITNQVAGTGIFGDMKASMSDLFGGNSGVYRESMNRLYRSVIEDLKEKAAEMGANAIIGVRIDYDNISAKSMSMFMVSIQGTAVRIANNAPCPQESKDNKISWEELNLAYHKRKIRRKIESDEHVTDEEWDFVLKNDVGELTSVLYQYYQKCIAAPMINATISGAMLVEPIRLDWADSGVSNFKKYLSKLDYNDAIKYAYENVYDFMEVITSNKLFNASKILNIAENGELDLAISLLGVEKSSYNIQDLSEMQKLSEYLENLPDVGKKEEVKGGLFSPGGLKFICSCGKKNEISSDDCDNYCSDCGKNIKGITREEQQTIDNYVELVETLSDFFNS